MATKNEQQPYSSDPFAPNYRYICPWDEETKADYIATYPWPLPPNWWDVYESAERAEFTRPSDQLDALLRERGLLDGYREAKNGCAVKMTVEQDGEQIRTVGMDGGGSVERARQFLIDAGVGDEILERANEIFRLEDLRSRVLEGPKGWRGLLDVGDVVGYNWHKMNNEVTEWSLKELAKERQQGSGSNDGNGSNDADAVAARNEVQMKAIL